LPVSSNAEIKELSEILVPTTSDICEENSSGCSPPPYSIIFYQSPSTIIVVTGRLKCYQDALYYRKGYFLTFQVAEAILTTVLSLPCIQANPYPLFILLSVIILGFFLVFFVCFLFFLQLAFP